MHDGAAIPSAEGDRRAVALSGGDAGQQAAARAPSPALTTARLRLDPVAEHDLDELLALHCDPRAFAEDSTAPLTDRGQMAWVLEQWRESWAVHGVGHLCVRAHPDAADLTLPPGMLGVVGLAPVETQGRMVLSAYWRLCPEVTGRGVAAESMRAVLAHPWPVGRAGRTGATPPKSPPEIVAVTAAGNGPSLALAARLGFVLAAPQRPVPGGRDGDVLLTLPGRAPTTPAPAGS